MHSAPRTRNTVRRWDAKLEDVTVDNSRVGRLVPVLRSRRYEPRHAIKISRSELIDGRPVKGPQPSSPLPSHVVSDCVPSIRVRMYVHVIEFSIKIIC